MPKIDRFKCAAEDIPDDLRLSIVPGFINYNECLSFLDTESKAKFLKLQDLNVHPLARLANSHHMLNLVLDHCEARSVQAATASLANPVAGRYLSGLFTLAGTSLKKERARNQVIKPIFDRKTFLDFGCSHFINDTGRLDQTHRNRLAAIAKIRAFDDESIILQPLIMGHSIFEPKDEANRDLHPWVECLNENNMQVYPHEIEEFKSILNVQRPKVASWQKFMQVLPEVEVKKKFAELLSVVPDKDWGGETCDLVSTDLHIGQKRFSAAFAFKGPGSKFSKMQLTHLGKNADQVMRMAYMPVDMLVLQHCHEITPTVIDHLRRTAVYPPTPKRFCIIDGSDTYRLFLAYGLV